MEPITSLSDAADQLDRLRMQIEGMRVALEEHKELIAQLRKIKDEAQERAKSAEAAKEEALLRWRALDKEVNAHATNARRESDRADELALTVQTRDRSFEHERMAHREQQAELRAKLLASAQETAKVTLHLRAIEQQLSDAAKELAALRAENVSLRGLAQVPATLSGDKD